jgi:hypothetical protein
VADTRKDLGNNAVTVGDYLKSKYLASTLYWGARPLEGDVWTGIDPTLRRIPDVQLGASFTPQGGREKNLSVGYGNLLRYTTGTREGPEGPVGRPKTDFNQVTGRVGPFDAYWEQTDQEGKVGGSLDYPVQLGLAELMLRAHYEKTLGQPQEGFQPEPSWGIHLGGRIPF